MFGLAPGEGEKISRRNGHDCGALAAKMNDKAQEPLNQL
jgi:hypothetical protein